MPTPNDVLIANQALSRIGVTQTVTGFSGGVFTDNSPAAQALNTWYLADRDAELTDWPWPWASKYIALSQVSITGIPTNPEWDYAYRYPADCLSVRRIVSGYVVTNALANPPPATTNPAAIVSAPLVAFRPDGDASPWPFEIGSDAIGKLVYTDSPSAWIKYTYSVTDASQWSADFADLLAWRIAKDLYGMSRDDKRREYAEQMYEKMRVRTQCRFANEAQNSQPFVDYNSETIRARFSDLPSWGH